MSGRFYECVQVEKKDQKPFAISPGKEQTVHCEIFRCGCAAKKQDFFFYAPRTMKTFLHLIFFFVSLGWAATSGHILVVVPPQINKVYLQEPENFQPETLPPCARGIVEDYKNYS